MLGDEEVVGILAEDCLVLPLVAREDALRLDVVVVRQHLLVGLLQRLDEEVPEIALSQPLYRKSAKPRNLL